MHNSKKVWLTLFTLVSCVSRHTLAAEGAPLAVTATPVATGWIAHVDTAAISGQAAWGAGLRVGRGAQIIQLSGGEEIVNVEKRRGEEMNNERWTKE